MANSNDSFATRIPDEDAERLKAVIRATDWNQSDAVGRAIQYYLDEDPDDILAPDPLESTETLMDSMWGSRD